MTLLPDPASRLDEVAARYDVPGAVLAIGYGDELVEAGRYLHNGRAVPRVPDGG
jgi:hypothetical protein